jgi:hypothetical protein
MRTENDLRQALFDAEPAHIHAPALLERVHTGATRRRRRRVALTVAASVAAVAAIATAIPVAARQGNRGTGTGTPAATSATAATPTTGTPRVTPPSTIAVRLQFTFEVRPVAGYRIAPLSIEPAVQRADIALAHDTAKSYADLTVYAARAYSPTEASRGTPVTVNGRRGYYASLVDPDTGGTRKPAVAWEYAPGAWAVVQGDWPQATAKAEELKIAGAVRFDRTQPLRVPYRARGLPPTLHPYSGFVGGSGTLISIVELTDRPITSATPQGAKNGESTAAVHLEVRGDGYIVLANTVIGGRPAYVSGSRVQVHLDNGYTLGISTTRTRAADYPPAVLRRIAEALIPAPHVADLGTWYDALTALPR